MFCIHNWIPIKSFGSLTNNGRKEAARGEQCAKCNIKRIIRNFCVVPDQEDMQEAYDWLNFEKKVKSLNEML